VALSEAVKAVAYPPIPFLDGSVLCYGVYPAKDGEVALAALEAHLWARFCEKVGLPELLHAAFGPARGSCQDVCVSVCVRGAYRS
jgi:alpha-methylacyl-CoA racemase